MRLCTFLSAKTIYTMFQVDFLSLLLQYCNISVKILKRLKWFYLSYIHTRRPTNPRSFPTNFYGLVGYDWVKNYPLWLKSVSIPDKPPLYLRCIPDAPTLKSRSSRPTPVLPADQFPLCTTNPRPIPDATTLTTLNIGPTPDLISTPE